MKEEDGDRKKERRREINTGGEFGCLCGLCCLTVVNIYLYTNIYEDNLTVQSNSLLSLFPVPSFISILRLHSLN